MQGRVGCASGTEAMFIGGVFRLFCCLALFCDPGRLSPRQPWMAGVARSFPHMAHAGCYYVPIWGHECDGEQVSPRDFVTITPPKDTVLFWYAHGVMVLPHSNNSGDAAGRCSLTVLARRRLRYAYFMVLVCDGPPPQRCCNNVDATPPCFL